VGLPSSLDGGVFRDARDPIPVPSLSWPGCVDGATLVPLFTADAGFCLVRRDSISSFPEALARDIDAPSGGKFALLLWLGALAPKWPRPSCYLASTTLVRWAEGVTIQIAEDRRAQAERFVWENELRIAKQAALVERLEGDGHGTRRARELLVIFQGARAIARDHLRREHEKYRLPGDPPPNEGD
jgi:hypothetical protein